MMGLAGVCVCFCGKCHGMHVGILLLRWEKPVAEGQCVSGLCVGLCVCVPSHVNPAALRGKLFTGSVFGKATECDKKNILYACVTASFRVSLETVNELRQPLLKLVWSYKNSDNAVWLTGNHRGRKWNRALFVQLLCRFAEASWWCDVNALIEAD